MSQCSHCPGHSGNRKMNKETNKLKKCDSTEPASFVKRLEKVVRSQKSGKERHG